MNKLLAWVALAVAACSSDPDFEPWVLDNLTGEAGFSLRIPETVVPAGRELQNCYFVRVPDMLDGRDLWIDRIELALNPGSHHFNVFRVKTIIGLDPAAGTPIQLGDYEGTVVEGSDEYATNPCWDSANWADWPLVANSQKSTAHEPVTEWKLPDEVAIRFTPGELLMLQMHYVNATDQPTPYGARVGANFHNTSPRPSLVEMGSLFATQQNIRICRSNPVVTYSGTCRFPNAVTIDAANGHFHKRGDQFRIYPWDGMSAQHPDPATQFYLSEDWDHPPMTFDIGLSLPANNGIWWDCQYRWRPPTDITCDEVDAKDPEQANDCCYTFGGNTDVGEHCNVFLYYYPRLDSDVFCI